MKFQEIFTKKYVFTKNFWQHCLKFPGSLALCPTTPLDVTWKTLLIFANAGRTTLVGHSTVQDDPSPFSTIFE